jgi:hypothetical protein
MRNPQVRSCSVRYPVRKSHNIQKGPVRLAVRPPASVVGVPPTRSMQHNTVRRISGRVEPATPCEVVLPACSRDTAATPEGDPPRFLILRHPRPVDAPVLSIGDDIAHPSILVHRPKTGDIECH